MQAESKNISATETTSASNTKSLLRIDTTNMYSDATGDSGVARAEMRSIAATAERTHVLVAERRRGGLDAEYGCLNLHEAMSATLTEIKTEADKLSQFQDVLVLGIGGSNLGALAVYQALAHGGQRRDRPQLLFVDNIDPDYLHDLLSRLAPDTTGVITISKSGGTIETLTQYLVVRQWLAQHLGAARARSHQWIVTDPSSGWLRALANSESIHALPVPPTVGGRYSVLTAVGLLPLAAAGIDIDALLAGARDNAARCEAHDLERNPALEMAALYYLLDVRNDKRVSVLMPYVNALRLFGDWYRQLWAESLGKRRADGVPAGTLPVPALGAVDQHSQLQMYLESRRDKIFSFIAAQRWVHAVPIPLNETERAAFPYLAGKTLGDVLTAEFAATRHVITAYGHPNLTIYLHVLDAYALGQLIDLYQRVTVYAGLLYGINPLDQPAVESGKHLTRQYLQGA